jgi:branched-chain amino acid transport system substrate-binding protein
MTRLFIVAALAASLIAPAGHAEDLTIGIVTATSGPLAAAGKFQINGFNLAAETINNAGGLKVGDKTYRVVLKMYDTHCSAAEGASAMQRLADIDKVPVVLGELCSPVAAAESPIAQEAEIPLILTVPTADTLTAQANPYVFRVNAANDQLNKALAQWVISHAMTPLAYIAWNNDAGRGGVQGVNAQLPASGARGYIGYFNVGEVDFSSHITNIRNSGAKAVMLLMDEEPGALAIRQMRSAGLGVQLVGTLAMGSNRFLARLNAAMVAGMVQYDSFPPNANIPRIKAFNDAYRARFGEESHGFAAQSYDGLMVAAAALSLAGQRNGKAVRDALAKISHEGVIGHIAFDAKGQASPPVYVTQWCDNGTRKIVFPATLASECGGG